MTPRLRLAGMLMRLGIELARGLWRLRAFPRLNAQQRHRAIRAWSRRMLRAARTRLQVVGEPHEGACLLAVNHVSWLDIMALNAAHPTRFVSKAEVRHWPVLGKLVAGAGTLFIERERARDAMRVMHDMAQCLRNGEQVSVFPEGTTSDGTHVLALHANLFQAALSADTPVQPVLLRYLDDATGAPSRAPAYVGDDTVMDTLRLIAAGEPVRVVVHYLPALRGQDRRQLAAAVHEALSQALQEPVQAR
ncbi:1-acyl-sn-glycerol-3-phosphate acyltransferase [Thiomonas sp.]|uniref:lysophospholipid acyltransferase family protein n=1 Tax=Thiomonas sp. TaxID=2047785 RepID=UPI0026385666|nr:lysophospholipid acyltransferase family protein [Thiomonas sp.]